MTRREKALLAAAAGLLALSVLCFAVVPGVRFSAILAVALALLCVLFVLLGRWAERNRFARVLLWTVRGAFAAGAVLFLTLEGMLLFQGERDNTARGADAVIVLGAGVNGETPSLILKTRIDAAAYLLAHPEVPAVLSGGQGPGEEITEAEAMRRALTALGVEESRLWLEEESTSTAENFRFSKAVLVRHGIEPETAEICVVTSDFHCFRAEWIAKRAGLTTFALASEVPWRLLSANYYIRESFALVKTLIFD
ncbi:YdcF family protein [Oscillibacter sp.]|uniref:YdcF family protein n=1 Tax=Oscillibacter sp. TaxID=1945593 RepID=UPI002638BA6F|nr:YdcF family protein [Oscillibacter sp.]MDD3347838.1 YdcF family protein [Oscillibacter sp.]